VENCLHLIKDRWWDEDKHHLSRPGVGEVWTSLTNFALSVGRLLKEKSEPMTAMAEKVRDFPKQFLRRFGYRTPKNE
jgi:hypothetical protein